MPTSSSTPAYAILAALSLKHSAYSGNERCDFSFFVTFQNIKLYYNSPKETRFDLSSFKNLFL